jgi:FkbM family methyltransferase
MSVTEKFETTGKLPRYWRFLQKPWREKARWADLRLRDAISRLPKPVRLPSGSWWLLRNDNLGRPLQEGVFETRERAFVARFLRPGMTVLDIGAHQGLYTLLASRKVGAAGKVFAFEPSHRERRALWLNIALNICTNVTVQSLAVGSCEGEADLFVVQGGETGCNSLRPPIVGSGIAPVRVRVTTLDGWLQSRMIPTVDFIKLDIEGGELEALKGAARTLNRRPRPVMLVEVQDVRTAPWGYRAREILTCVRDARYMWFKLLPGGWLEDLDPEGEDFEGNFVACPEEGLEQLRPLRPSQGVAVS